MERLWAPWRMEYILDEKPAGCIFCLGRDGDDDRKSLILHRTPRSLVMMNRYPYVNGHLMVAPRKHTGQASAGTAAARDIGCRDESGL